MPDAAAPKFDPSVYAVQLRAFRALRRDRMSRLEIMTALGWTERTYYRRLKALRGKELRRVELSRSAAAAP